MSATARSVASVVEVTLMTDAAVDGGLLDDLETEFRQRYYKRERGEYDRSEQAITSGELADTFGIEDAEGNPKTREAIKILKRERGLPLVGGPDGYRIPLSGDAIDDYHDSLEGRIEGIRENQRLMQRNWRSWQQRQAAYQPTTVDVPEVEFDDAGDIPDEVRERIESDPVLTVKDVLEHMEGSA